MEQHVCTHESEPRIAEPKPCPKCGNKAPAVVPTLLGGEYYVACRQCHTETPIAPTKAAAIELWNHDAYE